MDKKIKESLLKFGFSELEAKIYYATLVLFESSVDKISKHANINRTSCYTILDRLKKQGLVSHVKKSGKLVFKACKPDKLVSILNEKLDFINDIIPDLKSVFEFNKGKPNVTFYDSKEGLKTVLNSILDEAKEILTIGDGDSFRRAIPGWTNLYSNRRAKKNIKAKILIKATPLAIRVAKEYKQSKSLKSKMTQLRVLPELNGFEFSGCNIYNNKVVFLSYEKQVVAVVIESKIISKMLKVVFNTLWQVSEKYNHTLLKD